MLIRESIIPFHLTLPGLLLHILRNYVAGWLKHKAIILLSFNAPLTEILWNSKVHLDLPKLVKVSELDFQESFRNLNGHYFLQLCGL